jgi:predicted pyridoxine 5'-phosphate oxidase superfamily flavin-nucleotide-binding protein
LFSCRNFCFSSPQPSPSAGVPLKSKGAIIFKIEEIYDIAPGPDAGKRLA